jgi:hypothetical protein
MNLRLPLSLRTATHCAAWLGAALLAAGCASTTSGSVAAGGQGRSQLLLVSSDAVMQQSLQYYEQQNKQARAKGDLITSGPNGAASTPSCSAWRRRWPRFAPTRRAGPGSWC